MVYGWQDANPHTLSKVRGWVYSNPVSEWVWTGGFYKSLTFNILREWDPLKNNIVHLDTWKSCYICTQFRLCWILDYTLDV